EASQPSLLPRRAPSNAPIARRPRGSPTQGAPRKWRDADLARLGAELRPVIDGMAALVLPLVHHLVQQGVPGFLPPVPADVPPAERDLGRLPMRGARIVAEATPHASRHAQRYRFQSTVEVLGV